MTEYLDRTPSGYKVVGGTLWGWGYGSAGALGNFASTNRSSPVQEATSNTSWKSISTFYHSLAIKHDNTLWAWGFNNNGQLGDNSISNKSSPVQIPGTTWKITAAGHYHSAAIKTDGSLWTWGDNSQGQLGDNDVTDKSSPVQTVAGGSTWESVDTGRYHTVAIKQDGTLWAWGHNYLGALGDNTITHRSSPVQEVLANTMWKSVSCGRWHTLSIRTDGTLWAWGENGDGQLGKNDRVHRSSPVQEVSGGTNWKVVSGGYYHSAAIKTDGTLWTWGRGGGGRLGNGSTNGRSSPAQTIIEGTDWKNVKAAGWHSAALKTDGSIWTWGDNDKGNLGNDDYISQYYPDKVDSPFYFKDISADGETTFGLVEASADVVSGSTGYFSEPQLWSWGHNGYGNVGDNTTTHRSSPVQEITGSINWKKVGTGTYHSAVIKTDGTLWLWGYNHRGQLGDNSVADKSSPVQTVSTGLNWKEISAGLNFTAAIKTDNTLWLWGSNTDGNLGDNSVTHRSSPVQTVSAGTTWKNVSAGVGSSAAAIKTDGTLWLWGNNTYGQLGDNSVTHRSSPVQTISGGTNWKQVSIGFNTAAIKTDGTLWGWGINSSGSVGDNTNIHRSSPVQEMTGGTNWKQVCVGNSTTAAIKMDNTLWLWGSGVTGAIGDDTIVGKSSPTQTIAGGSNWKKVSFGSNAVAAIKMDGTLWLWGHNHVGQLGVGDLVHRSSPVQTLAGGSTWIDVNGGFVISALKDERPQRATNGLITQEYFIDVYPNLSQQFKQAGLWGWGDASNGELGDGTQVHRSSPVQTLSGGSDWISGDTGYGHTAMIKSNGTLWSWGRGGSGQLGDFTRTSKSSPVQETTLTTTWKTVSVGRYHSAAVRTDGTLWAWGFNGNGGLGINSTASRSSPVQEVLAATTWKMVSCGGYFTAAVRTDGTLWAWGYNTTGQLGKNDLTHRSSPVQEVLAATTWKSVSAGAYHASALRSDGTLWTWGRNTSGQLGKNDVVHRSSPVQELTSGTTWTTVSCGAYHTAAVKADGTLWAWGDNTEGQLGDNTLTRKSSPVQTVSGGTNWKKILGGQNFTAALKTDGSLWAWGHNNYGQLGMGDIVHRSSPAQVPGGSYNWIELVGHGRAYRMLAIRDDSEDTL